MFVPSPVTKEHCAGRSASSPSSEENERREALSTMTSTNGNASKSAFEQSRKETKEASMKRVIKVVEPEKEVRRFERDSSLFGSLFV